MNHDNCQRIRDTIREISKQQRQSFFSENHVLSLSMQNQNAGPQEIAEMFTQLYGNYEGSPLNGNGVIRVYRRCRLASETERRSTFRKAVQAAEQIDRAFQDGKTALPALASNSQRKRLVLLALAERGELLKGDDIHELIFRLNRDFAAECMDSILDLLHLTIQNENQTPIEQKQQEIDRLQTSLNRTSKLLHDLQESFEEQLLESSQDEQEKFFSMLNSERYGHILDLLSTAQAGFRQMRRERKNIPFELRNIQTLVRRLLEFVEDCGVTPIQETGTRLSLTAKDLTGFQFEGTPFQSDEEIKVVEIVSPGWTILERGIVIAPPRVREIQKEDIIHG